jgi:hypothetical protein
MKKLLFSGIAIMAIVCSSLATTMIQKDVYCPNPETGFCTERVDFRTTNNGQDPEFSPCGTIGLYGPLTPTLPCPDDQTEPVYPTNID